MTESEIKGIIPPLITCFEENGEIYEEGQRRLVSFLNQHVHGYWVCGSYGSFPLLSTEERKKVLEIVIDESSEENFVLANIGSASPREAVELGKHAEDVGADAMGSVPPFYHSHREQDIKYHFEIIKEEVDLPLFFYNNPNTTGYTLNSDFLNQLITEDLIDGIKDSGFDILQFYDYMRKTKKVREKKDIDFTFIIGTESLMVPALINGANGSIAGLANCIPEDCAKCYEAIMDGRIEEAVSLQNRILEERDITHMAPSAPSVQKILKIRGLDAGYPRPPFQEPDEKTVERMKESLDEMNIGEIRK